MPGRWSRRKDLRGGRDSNVASLKDGAGKDETYKWSREGSRLKISVKSRESIVPPGLQCIKSLCRLDQREW
jgi:hypothetical protein